MMRVLLMSDYNGWPLWTEKGATGPDDWPTLSAELHQALQAWEDYWDINFHYTTGWSDGAKDWYVTEGLRLASQLQAELGQEVDVHLTP